ncbi:MAG: spike base protein, RCAP_Rcc01079 family [Bacteroidales bacterium]
MSLDLSKMNSTHSFIKELYKKFFGLSGESPIKIQQSGSDGLEKTGVCNGTDVAATSNTVDLPNPGYFEVAVAGTVKFDPILGAAAQTRNFEAKECSKFRVKRIYVTGTSATGIVIYY